VRSGLSPKVDNDTARLIAGIRNATGVERSTGDIPVGGAGAVCSVVAPVGGAGAVCSVVAPVGGAGAVCSVEPPVGGAGAVCSVEPPVGGAGAVCSVEPPVGGAGAVCSVVAPVGGAGAVCSVSEGLVAGPTNRGGPGTPARTAGSWAVTGSANDTWWPRRPTVMRPTAIINRTTANTGQGFHWPVLACFGEAGRVIPAGAAGYLPPSPHPRRPEPDHPVRSMHCYGHGQPRPHLFPGAPRE